MPRPACAKARRTTPPSPVHSSGSPASQTHIPGCRSRHRRQRLAACASPAPLRARQACPVPGNSAEASPVLHRREFDRVADQFAHGLNQRGVCGTCPKTARNCQNFHLPWRIEVLRGQSRTAEKCFVLNVQSVAPWPIAVGAIWASITPRLWLRQ